MSFFWLRQALDAERAGGVFTYQAKVGRWHVGQPSMVVFQDLVVGTGDILIPKSRTDSGTNHVRRSWSLLSLFCHCRCRCCRRCDCRRPSRSHPSFSSSCSSSYCSCSANVFFLKLKEHRGYPICSSPLCQCDVDPTAEVTFFPRFVALVHGHGESTRYAIPGALAAFSKG